MVRFLSSLLCVLFLVSGCGSFTKKPKAPEVSPDEQSIVVGSESVYVLDPTQSDSLIQSSRIIVSIFNQDEDKTSFRLEGEAKTALGGNSFAIERDVPNVVLSKEFLDEFRIRGEYSNEAFQLKYLGMNDQGCDLFEVSGIKDFAWIKIEPLLCLGERNIPKLDVKFSLYGKKIKAVYLLQ